MIAATGILTSRGGKTSHAAVVARGMGKTAVCGAESLEVDAAGLVATGRRGHRAGGRRALHRRLDRRGVRRRAPGRALSGGALPRGGARTPHWSRSTRAPQTWSGPSTGCSPTPTAYAGCGCGPTPTPARTPTAPGGWEPRESGCAAPSTCSSASGARSSNASSWPTARRSERLRSPRSCDPQTQDFVELLDRHGRPAHHDPPAGPAPPRVPSRPCRADGQGGGGEGARRGGPERRRGCWRRSSACTSRTRCSGCAASAWDSPCPGCSPSRCARSPRRRRNGSRPAATRVRRSWCRWSARSWSCT